MASLLENKHLWQRHVLAENRRQLDELLDTLSDDCVYEIVPTGHAFRGKAEVAEFYRSLWAAIPDARLVLKNRIIGEDGILEESVLTGLPVGELFGFPPTSERIELPMAIVFPMRDGKILGERIYFDSGRLRPVPDSRPTNNED
jgi:steroid delta-isomerase-like uncharacterized protein